MTHEHYVRNAKKKTITIDIYDYSDVILEEIARKKKHKKRDVIIAILDYFTIAEKKWLDEIGVEFPEELKNLSLEEFIRRSSINKL